MTSRSRPKLTIVILSYNSQFWLKQTLLSLHEHYLKRTPHQVQVIVVDNHSQDDSVAMLKKDFGWVELIENAENSGFAAGNNLALKNVDSEYVMLLNSDMELVSSSNFDLLLDYLDHHPEAGVITPYVTLTNGKIDPASHRGEPTLWASLTYFAGLEKKFKFIPFFSRYHQWYKPLNEIHTIDACSGAAMIVRTSAMKKVGLLDEQFFMYAEDLDWCKRFRDNGYTIVFYPHVTVTHHKYKSGLQSNSSLTAKKTSTHFYDTMLQYYDKHYRNRYPEFVRTGIKYLLSIKKGAL